MGKLLFIDREDNFMGDFLEGSTWLDESSPIESLVDHNVIARIPSDAIDELERDFDLCIIYLYATEEVRKLLIAILQIRPDIKIVLISPVSDIATKHNNYHGSQKYQDFLKAGGDSIKGVFTYPCSPISFSHKVNDIVYSDD